LAFGCGWCGFGVGDHEEGENQECAALELVERDGEWVAEPEGANEEKGDPETEEGEGCCAAFDFEQDEGGEAGAEGENPYCAAPLCGGYPDLIGQQEQDGDDAEIGGVEDVFVVCAQEKFTGDGDDCGEWDER